jgi:hypothetical protein
MLAASSQDVLDLACSKCSLRLSRCAGWVQPLEGAQNRRAGAGLGGFLGTWTKRQVHYQRQLPPPSLPAQIPGTPQAAAAAAHSSSSRAKRRSPAAAAAAAGGAAAAAQLPASSAAAGEGRTPGGSRRPSAERTSEAGEAGGAAEGLADADAARAVLLASEEGKVAAAAAAAEPDAAPSGRSEDSAGGLGEDEEGARQAAWRWRFNKRWAQEQARMPPIVLCWCQKYEVHCGFIH